MLNATDNPQSTPTPTGASPEPKTPDVSTPSDTPAVVSSTSTPISTTPAYIPPSFASSSHPPTAVTGTPAATVKSDIADGTEKDGTYASALATKVGGAEPTLMTFKPTDAKPDTIPAAGVAAVGLTSGATVGATSSSTPPTSKSAKKGGFSSKIIGGIVAMLVLVAGLGAGYYLQTQQQDLEEKAYSPGAITSTLHDVLKVYHADDGGSCPVITDENAIKACPADASSAQIGSSTNAVSTYSAKVVFENITDGTLQVMLENHSYWCEDQPFGQVWRGSDNTCSIGCGDTSRLEDKTITIEPGQKVDVSLSRSSDSGAACGSYQLDWFVKKIMKGDSVVFNSEGGEPILASWGMCQTGLTCEQPETKISGAVECVNPADGKKYPILSGSVAVGDKTFNVENGSYTADVTAGDMIFSRLTLPASFQISLNGTPTTIQSANTKTEATNGCLDGFMTENCSGITPERATQCTNNNNLTNSYEWCTIPEDSTTTRSGFDFLVTNCAIPTTTPTPTPGTLACVGTTFTPTSVVAGGTNQMTVTCQAVAGAKSYKLTVPSNTATQAPLTVVKPAPATGNATHTFTLNTVPAGTYNASCVPCTDTAGTTCIASTAATCKASVTVTAKVDGVAACQSKQMFAVSGTTLGAEIAAGSTIQTGATVQYRINVNASSMTAGEVTVTDTLPSTLELVDKLDFDYNANTRVLSKTLPAFTGDKALNARVRVKHSIAAGSIVNTAQVKTMNANNAQVGTTSSCETAMVVPSYSCNTSCTANEQCQGANADYTCSASNNNRCRLVGNESSENCQPKTFACNSACSTTAECQSVNGNYSCVSTTDGNRCRLTTNQGAANCQTASTTPTPTPAVGCNQTCTNNADCSNPNHVCHLTGTGSVCRLADDVNSTTCSIAQATTQPAPPAELPQSGPENWSNWLKSGLVVIGIGAMLLLLL